MVSQGSYGIVFRAERAANPEAGPFALKLALQPGDPRFALEAELLSRIHHPNVPRPHDSGQWSGPGGALFPFLVMDWVEGLPLYSWARLQPRSSRQQLRVLAQASSALQAVHAAGGIHRDVKGDNLLVRAADGHVCLVDFGSCTFRGAPVLTRQSEPPGTPHYHSPQAQLHQWRFRRHPSARYESSPEDDVYALGVTAYHLATGRYPLIADGPEADGELDDAFSRFPELVPADNLVQLSPELARWIRQMLTVEPESRGTAAELASGLALAADTEGREADRPTAPRTPSEQREQEPPPIPERQPIPWRKGITTAAAGVALVVGGVGLGHALRDQSLLAEAWDRARAAQAIAQEKGTSALGEAARAEPLKAPEPLPTHKGVSAAVPREPLPNQQLPPCKRPQVELNGSCWIRVADEAPPCVESTYEWRKRCYWPVFLPSRPTTSGQK
ncbi:serine/threonine-protein kinase [Hyalangium sp.]|uniref:serine/threonine-protein kinase n=1 Tax=Hyalangium sp. TaxID=2028555 RepID=UPI002D4033B0|nr:serine/threonine-protein kinase [Hyalangium sp.]HYI00095.1 serine/threonine-protein kinase [Hyalangium sp.]